MKRGTKGAAAAPDSAPDSAPVSRRVFVWPCYHVIGRQTVCPPAPPPAGPDVRGAILGCDEQFGAFQRNLCICVSVSLGGPSIAR